LNWPNKCNLLNLLSKPNPLELDNCRQINKNTLYVYKKQNSRHGKRLLCCSCCGRGLQRFSCLSIVAVRTSWGLKGVSSCTALQLSSACHRNDGCLFLSSNLHSLAFSFQFCTRVIQLFQSDLVTYKFSYCVQQFTTRSYRSHHNWLTNTILFYRPQNWLTTKAL
jgi:hypothetical protein